jgi:hypothetical protein
VHHHLGQRLHGSRRCRTIASLALCVGLCPAVLPASSEAAASLPDGRAYELVSPPDMQGTSILPVTDASTFGLPEAWDAVATDGGAVLWRTVVAPPGAPDSTGYIDVYRSVRGSQSWKATYVTPPSATVGTYPPLVEFVSPDADRILWSLGNATIDPSDHDPVETAVSNLQWVDLYRGDVNGVFERQTRGSIEVPAGGEVVNFYGASQDLGRVVFGSNRQLEPGAPSWGGLYQHDGQTTRLVSKDETGTPLPDGVQSFGSSGDGSVVAFSTSELQVLYVWSERSDATVLAVGPVLPGAPQGGDLRVDSISADGSRIYFTTAGSLTADDSDTSRDLYVYDSDTRDVTLLSAPSGGGPRGNSDACAAPLPNAGQCDISPVTETSDGSKVYFVSPEQIVAGQGVDGGANLYVSTPGGVRFVATLDPADPVYGLEGVRMRHVRVTPDGSKLMFESSAQVTSYDNAGHREVYLYDPTSGTLDCVSCRPNGTAPTGDSFLAFPDNNGASPVFGSPPLSPTNADAHGDRVFFDSYDAIVPKDANGRSDVYQYTVATRTPALISSGTSASDSAYVGSGVDGRDVFFLTTDTLAAQDRNGNVYKLYDARIGGGFPTSSTPPPCQGASCRPDEAAPQPATQASDRVVPRTRSSQPVAVVPRLVLSGARSVRGTSLRLTVKVSGAGSIKVTGRGLVSTSRKTSRAASYHLTVRLSKASVAKLRHAHRLTSSATVRFAPSRGTARTVGVRLTFTAPSNRKAR